MFGSDIVIIIHRRIPRDRKIRSLSVGTQAFLCKPQSPLKLQYVGKRHFTQYIIVCAKYIILLSSARLVLQIHEQLTNYTYIYVICKIQHYLVTPHNNVMKLINKLIRYLLLSAVFEKSYFLTYWGYFLIFNSFFFFMVFKNIIFTNFNRVFFAYIDDIAIL